MLEKLDHVGLGRSTCAGRGGKGVEDATRDHVIRRAIDVPLLYSYALPTLVPCFVLEQQPSAHLSSS
jgi:hypothetical protein